MAKLSDDARLFYENTLRESKKQIEIIDAKIEEELARVKEIINDMKEQKTLVRQIYDSSVQMLGVENEFEIEERNKMHQ